MYDDKRSEGQEVARAVSKLLNNYNSTERKVFIDEMSRDHRSLQQSFTRLCVDWLRNLAEREEGRFDLRNEASVKLAREVLPILDRSPLPLI